MAENLSTCSSNNSVKTESEGQASVNRQDNKTAKAHCEDLHGKYDLAT